MSEQFLATAQVLVRPDTTGFAATLKAELTAIAKASAITVPVIAATTAGGLVATEVNKTTSAIEKQVAATRLAGAASVLSGKASTGLAHADTLAAAASQKLALAQGLVANAASKVGAAQITATRSTAAGVAAQKSLNAELAIGNAARIAAAQATLRLAAAQEAEASTALAAARAQAIHATRLGGVSKGASSAGLSMLGIRGATLAANASFLAGAAALIVFAKSLGVAARFEQELNVFRVTAQATAGEMERVSVAAEALGRDITLPAVSAGDAASAMTELAKAGLSVQDSITGARGVLQLATAAQIDNATATNIAASALNAFGLGGDQAVHVADLLANAANEAQGGISDMGLSLASVASVSRQVGISLTDTVALLTLLAKNGIQGAAGGTVLRVALLRLVAPSVAAAKIIKELGISIRDAQGNIRPEVFADFAAATEDLSNRERDAAAAIVFGTRGIRAQAILGREGAAALQEMAAAVEKEGTASAVAGARTAGFSGKVENAKNQVEALGLELGKLALPAAGGGVDILAFSFGELADQIKDTREAFSAVFGDDFKQTAEFVRFALGEVQGSARETSKDVRELFQAFRTSNRGASAVNELALALAKMIENLKGGDEEAQRLSKRLEGLLKTIQETGAIPPINIDILLNSPEAPKIEIPDVVQKITFDGSDLRAKGKQAGEESGKAVLDALAATLSPEAGRAIGLNLLEGVAVGAAEAAPKVSAVVAQTLDLKIAVAETQGGDQRVLALLRQKEAKQQAFLDRMLGRPQTKSVQKTVEQAANNLKQTQDAIQSILDTQAADAESAKSDILQAKNKADQALLDALGAEQSRATNLILRAAGTKSLKDDIKFAETFRNILAKQIETVRKSVKDAQTRATELRNLTTQLIKANADIKNLRQQAREQARQDRADRLDRQDESVQLDIELAQITENRSAEIRAHQARIRLLQQRIKNAKGHQLEIKRLKVEIAREKAAIRDLKGEVIDRGKAFKELTFQFLQTQQGFAANLLGNLIPGGMTGGLVGGASGAAQGLGVPQFNEDPTRGLDKESKISAGRDQGVTSGQGSTQIQILRGILRALQNLNGRASHPEATYQRGTGRSTMDTFGV